MSDETPTEWRMAMMARMLLLPQFEGVFGTADADAINRGRQAIRLLAEYRALAAHGDQLRWEDQVKALLRACTEGDPR